MPSPASTSRSRSACRCTSCSRGTKKHDDRAAAAWLTLVWLSPFIGIALYWLFGINRINRRALKLRGQRRAANAGEPRTGAPLHAFQSNLILRPGQVPFLACNRVRPLRSGDAAFPEMLGAIRTAKSSVALATYIFNGDRLGRRFVDALSEAQARGVQVRVLVDGVGALYSFPPIVWRPRRRGVRAA